MQAPRKLRKVNGMKEKWIHPEQWHQQNNEWIRKFGRLLKSGHAYKDDGFKRTIISLSTEKNEKWNDNWPSDSQNDINLLWDISIRYLFYLQQSWRKLFSGKIYCRARAHAFKRVWMKIVKRITSRVCITFMWFWLQTQELVKLFTANHGKRSAEHLPLHILSVLKEKINANRLHICHSENNQKGRIERLLVAMKPICRFKLRVENSMNNTQYFLVWIRIGLYFQHKYQPFSQDI